MRMMSPTYSIINNETLKKSYYKENVFQYIPFFEVYINNKRVDSIQTSSESVLEEFFQKNKIHYNNETKVSLKPLDKISLTDDF